MEPLNELLLNQLRTQTAPGERWVAVPGKYADRYLISDHYNLFSLTTGKLMKTYTGEDGRYVYLSWHHERVRTLISDIWDWTWGVIIYGLPQFSDDMKQYPIYEFN